MAEAPVGGGDEDTDEPGLDAPAVDVATRRSRALAHPIRARIVALLGDDEASPIELAKALGLRLGVVSYHVRVLAEAEVIELSRTSARRGAIQHHYRRSARAERYWESVELSPRLAAELTDEISAAISRARARGASEGDPGDDRIAVTVLVQPAAQG